MNELKTGESFSKLNDYEYYPRYRKSEMEWLEKIPTHWERRRFKQVVSNPTQKGDETLRHYVTLEHILSGEGKFVEGFEWNSKESSDYYLFESGDILFGKLRPYLRKYYLAENPGCCGTDILVFRPRKADLKGEFLFYLIQSEYFIAYTEATSYGAKMPRTSWEKIAQIPIWVPPRNEQMAISIFLDRETEKIDKLIEKKERLIELLEEKRQAIVTKAVTKGLDPDVPMKDSGVEWLGEIPEGWDVTRLGRLGVLSGSGIDKKSDADETDVRMVNYTDVFGNLRREIWGGAHLMKTTAPEWKVREHALQRGDILFTPTSETCDEIGMSAVVMEDLPTTVYSYHLTRFRSQAVLNLSFKKYFCNNSAVLSYFTSVCQGTTRMTLTRGDFKRTPVTIPPLDEQKQIGAFLDQETARIDRLIGKIEKAINKLKEYRTALISAAVTGKIDVRDEVESPTENRKETQVSSSETTLFSEAGEK